jgi:hypothetical protein
MKFSILAFLLTLGVHLSAQKNPIVIELFTSQGCSSCPRADKNLSTTLEEAGREGRLIYGLSFHVDYWNYIGWKDPYSNKIFTERQRKYAAQMGLQSIYTPQMIVNGQREFVGSNKSQLDNVVAQAETQKLIYEIVITEYKIIGDKISFEYSLDKEPTSESINFAIVEKSIENNVPRGENSGRKLRHTNVVRSFVTNAIKRKDNIVMSASNITVKNSTLIVYIQDEGLRVLGASAKAL